MGAADFWGEFVARPIRTPVVILREQAALLGPKTQNLVEAEVTTQVEGQYFYHSFDLVVPPLQGYRYRLFRIRHIMLPYPVLVLLDVTTELKDEEAFTNWLRSTLSSEETQRIINNLLAQAQS